MQENQNNQTYMSSGLGEKMPLSSSRLTVKDIMRKRKMADEQAIENNKKELATDCVNMWDCSHNVADDSQKDKLKMRSNTIGIANMIYDKSVSEGNKNIPSDTRGIMDMYKEEHPENWENVLNAIKDTSLDLDKYGIEQGWLPSDEEEEYNWLLEWVRNIAGQNGSFWSGPNMVAQGIQQSIYGLQNVLSKYTGDTPRDAALAEYAYATYGKDLSELTDREIAKAQEVLKDRNARMEYGDIMSNEYTELFGGILDTLFTAAFPGVKLGFSAADNTPVVNYATELLGRVIEGFGETLAGLNPLLWVVYEQLPEHQKSVFASSLGALGFYKASKNQRVKSMSRYYIEEIAESTPVKEVMMRYNGFKDRLSRNKNTGGTNNNQPTIFDKAYEKVDEWINKVKDRVTPKQLSSAEADERSLKYTKKLTGADLENQKAVRDALANLEGKEGMKTYKDIYDGNEAYKNELIELEDEILKYDTREFGLDDIENTLATDVDMWGENVPANIGNPLLDTLDGLIECYEETPVKQAQFRAMREALINGKKITKQDIAYIKREISKAVQTYKPLGGEPAKDKMSARMRKNSMLLSEFIRAGFDDIIPGIENPLKVLDSAYHDSYILSEYLWKQMKKADNLEGKVAPKGEARGSYRTIFSDIVKQFKPSIRGTAKMMLDKWARLGKMDALEMEEFVNEMLQDFDTLIEIAGKDGQDISSIRSSLEELKSIMEETPREYVDSSNGDWEVINPEEYPKRNVYDSTLYLEDKVDVENPESFMLGEDTNYNGQSPIDYTDTTRVTPEGNAGRKGQTIEQNKGEYREGVRTKIIEEYKDKYMNAFKKVFESLGADEEGATNAAKYMQETLFGDIEGGKRTDFLGRSVLKKGKKK